MLRRLQRDDFKSLILSTHFGKIQTWTSKYYELSNVTELSIYNAGNGGGGEQKQNRPYKH